MPTAQSCRSLRRKRPRVNARARTMMWHTSVATDTRIARTSGAWSVLVRKRDDVVLDIRVIVGSGAGAAPPAGAPPAAGPLPQFSRWTAGLYVQRSARTHTHRPWPRRMRQEQEGLCPASRAHKRGLRQRRRQGRWMTYCLRSACDVWHCVRNRCHTAPSLTTARAHRRRGCTCRRGPPRHPLRTRARFDLPGSAREGREPAPTNRGTSRSLRPSSLASTMSSSTYLARLVPCARHHTYDAPSRAADIGGAPGCAPPSPARPSLARRRASALSQCH